MILAGIDLGGTFIKAGIVTSEGKVIDRVTEATKVEQGYWQILNQMNALIERLIEQNHLDNNQLTAVGIGVPGTTSLEGMVYFANNLHWEDKHLVNDFSNVCHKPVFIENDASMAAYGELVDGSLKGIKDGMLITLGTGLGTGIIVGGTIFSGAHGIGRQAGHMKVGNNFYQCTCGGDGCLETFASATALVKYYHHITGNKASITAKEIMEAAGEGDCHAREAVDRLVHYLGLGIANLINIMDPEVIVLGGGLAKAGKQLLEPVKKSVHRQLFDKKRFYTDLRLAQLDDRGGIVGSAMYAYQKHKKEMSDQSQVGG